MIHTRYPNIVNSGTAIIPLKEEEKKEQNTTLGCRNLLKYSSTSWYIYYKPKSCLIYKEMIQDDTVITVTVDFLTHSWVEWEPLPPSV